jgi:hypothetical protein
VRRALPFVAHPGFGPKVYLRARTGVGAIRMARALLAERQCTRVDVRQGGNVVATLELDGERVNVYGYGL